MGLKPGILGQPDAGSVYEYREYFGSMVGCISSFFCFLFTYLLVASYSIIFNLSHSHWCLQLPCNREKVYALVELVVICVEFVLLRADFTCNPEDIREA